MIYTMNKSIKNKWEHALKWYVSHSKTLKWYVSHSKIRGRPKFGFGFGTETGKIYSFSQISVSTEFEYFNFCSISPKNKFIDSAKAK